MMIEWYPINNFAVYQVFYFNVFWNMLSIILLSVDIVALKYEEIERGGVNLSFIEVFLSPHILLFLMH